MEHNKSLTTLDLAYCKITKIENLENNTELNELWLNWNNIDGVENLEYLKTMPELTAVYLADNPVAKVHNYKEILQENLKKLE